MKFALRKILFDAVKDEPTGGGGAPVTQEAVNKAIETALSPIAGTLATITTALAALAKPAPVVTPPVVTPPAIDPAKVKDLPPAVVAVIEEQTRRIEQLGTKVVDLEKGRDEAVQTAEQANRRSDLSTALSGLEFVTPEAQRLSVDSLFGKITRSAIDQSLVIDNLPLASAVKKEFSPGGSLFFAIKPKSTGGAGATNGGQVTDTVIPIGGLKNLSPEDRAKAAKDIALRSRSIR